MKKPLKSPLMSRTCELVKHEAKVAPLQLWRIVLSCWIPDSVNIFNEQNHNSKNALAHAMISL